MPAQVVLHSYNLNMEDIMGAPPGQNNCPIDPVLIEVLAQWHCEQEGLPVGAAQF